jgi:hypothetical protein
MRHYHALDTTGPSFFFPHNQNNPCPRTSLVLVWGFQAFKLEPKWPSDSTQLIQKHLYGINGSSDGSQVKNHQPLDTAPVAASVP